jgi:tetratricopeptide (TPR) repeat protein
MHSMSIPRLRIGSRRLVALLTAAGIAVLIWPLGPWGVAEFCRSRGTAALQIRDDNLALVWFRRAESFDRKSGVTQFLLARTFRNLNRVDEMQRHLERAVERGFSRDRAERERLLWLAQIGQIDRLGSRLQELLDNSGDDGREILAALAAGYTIAFDVDSANFVLQEWMARYPDDSESYAVAARLKQSQAEWPAAIEFDRRALTLAPARTAVRQSLAQCLAKANDPTSAEPEFRRCLAEQPENVEIRVELAACLVNLGRLDGAKDLLVEALRRDPHHFEAARSLGDLELSQGNSDAALAILNPLVERWPRDKQLCTLVARAWQESGQADRAQPYWEEAERATAALEQAQSLLDRIKRDGGDVAARYELGKLLLDRRSREEGAGWLQSVLLYDPRHRAVHEALADFYDRTGELNLARMHRDLEAKFAASENVREP